MAHGGEEEYLTGDGADGGAGLGGAACGEARRISLRERLGADGGGLDGALAAELARIEMEEREEKGQALFTAYLQNEVSEEYCHEAAALLGYGLWWDEASSWSIASVEAWKADPPAGLPCRLALDCTAGGGGATPRPARIEMDVAGDLQVHGFRFQWK